MLFLPFLVFRPWPKRCFCCFLLFGHGRKSIFAVFPVSAVAETLFLLFSIHPPRRKADFRRFLSVVPLRKAVFCRFLLIVPLRNAVFHVFCVSSTDYEHFSAVFAFRRPTMSVFSRFLQFVSRQRAFSSYFSVSSPDDERFFAISAFRQPTTSIFQRFSHFVGRQ